MRLVRILAIALAAIAPLGALAVEPPHYNGYNCSECHVGHNSPGGSLTTYSGNFNLCESCHGSGGDFGFGSWSTTVEAVPGTGGRLHNFSGPADGLGATPPPAGTPMGDRLQDGKLECSTCHDQHSADAFPQSGRGTQHIKTPYKSAGASLGGTGVVTVKSAPSDLTAKFYLIRITAGGAVGTAKFSVSNDSKISWVQTDVTTSANVTLADGVVLQFSGGSFAAPSGSVYEEWSSYVSYPFLRVDNTDAAMCTTCHKDRNQTTSNVEGTGPIAGNGQAIVLGTTRFSHPVNEALSKTYDRTVGSNGPVLDADGSTTGDSNKTNDLVTGTGGIVTCLTCHHPHNADSNSLTEDPR